VYHKLRSFCKDIAPTWRATQITNLALAACAIFERRTLTLSHLAQVFPGPATPKVATPRHPLWHKLKRLRRFLRNPRLHIDILAQCLTRLGLAFSDEPGLRLAVLVDLTYLHPYAFLVASIPKGGRALPLIWRAFRRDLAGEACASENQLIEEMLDMLFTDLPATVEALLVGDREFARASLFRFLKKRGRGFVIRIDAQTCIDHPTYRGALSGLGLQAGDPPRWLPGARYGAEEQEPINLLAVWMPGYDEPWLLATTLTDPQDAFAVYRQRMKIEHGFRDWKHHLRLKDTLWAQDVRLVKGLLTVLAVLYWFICLLGERWTDRADWAKVACWGQPSFFKVALDLLTTQDPVIEPTWQSVQAWVREKLQMRQFLLRSAARLARHQRG
jgi:hypothetical protein